MQKVKVTCSLSFLLMAVKWADQMMNLIMESKEVVRARSCSSLFFWPRQYVDSTFLKLLRGSR